MPITMQMVSKLNLVYIVYIHSLFVELLAKRFADWDKDKLFHKADASINNNQLIFPNIKQYVSHFVCDARLFDLEP